MFKFNSFDGSTEEDKDEETVALPGAEFNEESNRQCVEEQKIYSIWKEHLLTN